MKSVSTFLISVLLIGLSTGSHAQGIYQLWGMTNQGGNDNIGLIYNVNAAGNNFQERHHFSITNPGIRPQLTHLKEYNGKFYGMVHGGGNNGSGIIFEWNPSSNTYTKKFSFHGFDGSGPLGSLLLWNGKFYGMTENGGEQAQGVIFEWDPATNVYTVKYNFVDNPWDGFNGYRPAGNLTVSNGKFYGMTAYGGDQDKGVIFEWDPATSLYAKKVDFNGNNGSRPFASLTLSAGKFYGMTTQGGNNDKGVIFEWQPAANIYTKKIDFNGSNGSNPYGNLIIKGSVFISLTSHGGINDDGVLFEWDPSTNNYTQKYDFDDANGYWPDADLALKDGKYYSTAFRGGANDAGVLFEWNPATNTYTKKVDLSTTDGKYPQSSLALYNGIFYGITTMGGNFNNGVLFEWNAVSNLYTKKIDLNDETKGTKPVGSLVSRTGKRYGMTNSGGNFGKGVIFEFDPATDQYTKKIDLSTANGSVPYGNLIAVEGKFYGMTSKGGDNDFGVIFEYDPSSNQYTKKFDFDYTNGSQPQGSLTSFGNKLYGMTNLGGAGGGVIFEYDFVTQTFTKKIDLATSTGSRPLGDLVVYNGKLYGITNKGGSSNSGVIFEWDPLINVYTKKIDLSSANGINPTGSMTLLNGKFYGTTESGGDVNKGVLFEWDPATNIYNKVLNFSFTDANRPTGSLAYSNGKLYGTTKSGGANNTGVIFEWDPASSIYTKLKDFTGNDGNSLLSNNNLSLLPAPVAKGTAGSCAGFQAITIDNTNNNVWVPITDAKGDAVAEINANGNNLGVVNTFMFVNDNPVREESSHRLYLDRNLTITAQFPISGSPVSIRLYIRSSEYLALKNAVNSNGQPSGINSINDIGIFKNDDACSAELIRVANPIPTIAAPWEGDYVLSGTITSFSSFYFANIAQGGPLPITNVELKGRLVKDDGEISWKTTDEFNTGSFELERSVDGTRYTTITKAQAVNQSGIHHYNYTDKDVNKLAVAVIYYRLKQNDLDGRFKYSGIIALNIKGNNIVMLYPNPAVDKTNLTISVAKPETVQGRIIDNAGRVVMQLQWNLPAGSSTFPINVSKLASGIYYLELKGETVNEHKQFIKQ